MKTTHTNLAGVVATRNRSAELRSAGWVAMSPQAEQCSALRPASTVRFANGRLWLLHLLLFLACLGFAHPPARAVDLDPVLIGAWRPPETPVSSGDFAGWIRRSVVRDGYAYAVTHGSAEQSIFGSLEIIDVRDPANPQRVGRYGTNEVEAVAVAGGRACVVSFRSDPLTGNLAGLLDVVDIRNPASPQRVGSVVAGDGRGVEIVGDQVFLTAVDSGRLRLRVFDISSPANPRQIGGIELGEDEEAPGFGPFVTVSGNFAFVNGAVGLYIIDISLPSNPQLVGLHEACCGLLKGKFAIVGNLALLPTGEMVDVSTPSNPRVVGRYSANGTWSVAVVGNLACMAVNENLGGGATGGSVEVIDFSNPANPKHVAQVSVEPTFGMGAFDISVSGNHAFVAAGGVLQVLDLSDPTNPRRLGPVSVQDVAVRGNYAYVAGGQAGLQVLDISNLANPRRVAGYGTPTFADRVALTGDRAHVLHDASLEIYDLHDPARPRLLGFYSTEGSSKGLAVSGTHAYVTVAGIGLQVVDLSDAAKPRRVGSYATTGKAFRLAVSDNRAYIVTNGTVDGDYRWDGALEIVDVSDPTNPRRIGRYGDPSRPGAFDVAISGNHAYLSGDAGLEIINVSDPTTPRRVLVPTGFSDANHAVAVVDKLAFAGSESAGAFGILNIDDPANSRFVCHYFSAGPVLGFAALGGAVLLATGESGLQIVDVSRAANFQRFSTHDTTGSAIDVAVSGNYAYVSVYRGMDVVDIRDPAAPKRVGVQNINGDTSDVSVVGNYAYITGGPSGLHIIDVGDAANPRRIGGYSDNYPIDGGVYGVVVSGDVAYLAERATGLRPGGLRIIEITNRATPKLVGLYTSVGSVTDVAVSGSYAYAIDTGVGLIVVDITQSAASRRVGSFRTSQSSRYVVLAGDYAYVTGYDAFEVIDIRNPVNPRGIGSLAMQHDTDRPIIAGNYAYVGTLGGLHVIDISDPAQPHRAGRNTVFSSYVHSGTLAAGKIFVAAGRDGLAILNLYTPPPQLRALGWSPQLGMRFSVSGEAGQAVQVQRSSDLLGWQDWFGVVLGSSPSEVNDPDTATTPSRFYRAVSR